MGKEEVADAMAYHEEMMDEYNKRKAEKMSGESCGVCGTPLYSDPGAHELGIYLHAVRYADREGRWSYETGLPAWAMPPAGEVGPVEVMGETKLVGVVEKVEGSGGSGEEGGEDGVAVGGVEVEKEFIEPSKPLWVMLG